MDALLNRGDRSQLRADWVRRVTGKAGSPIVPASTDASFRSYWRVRDVDNSPILMDAPPQREDIGAWLMIADRLRTGGLHAPAVYASDLTNGFILMEDLGDRTYLPALDDDSVEALYGDAIDALFIMQRDLSTQELPTYDSRRLRQELDLLPQWFVRKHLGVTPQLGGDDTLEAAFHTLCEGALEQPRVFVHRDYHSRNLLITEQNSPGIIDFQDAVRGPIAYDLVSLLRDCYIEWPEERVQEWVERYRLRLAAAGLTQADRVTFLRWFDWMGVHRHLKVLGIFSRLWYRDGKRQYLDDLPRVWGYTLRVASRYEELKPLAAILERWIDGRDLRIPVR